MERICVDMLVDPYDKRADLIFGFLSRLHQAAGDSQGLLSGISTLYSSLPEKALSKYLWSLIGRDYSDPGA